MMRSDNKGPISPKDAEKILERAKAELPGVKVRYGDPAEFADAILAEEKANPTLVKMLPVPMLPVPNPTSLTNWHWKLDKVPYTALTPKNWKAKHVHTALGDEVTLTRQ